MGQDITVINLDTGDAIETFNVKSIRYGRQVKMCWIGNSDGMVSENYITVKGCKYPCQSEISLIFQSVRDR